MTRPVNSPKGIARREAILRAATETLAVDGHRNSTLRAIARALEVEPAHILYYFDSREELLQAVIERWDDDAIAAAGGAVDERAALNFYVATIRHNLEIPGIVHLYLTLAAEAVHPEHTAHTYFLERFRRARVLLGDGIRFEQSAGLIAPDYDADFEARKLIALADGLQLQALVDSTVDAPGDLELAIAALRGDSA